MSAFLSWYLTVTFPGWLTFPLAHRLFPALADRGYTLSRVLGLLLWGYAFWLMAIPGSGTERHGWIALGINRVDRIESVDFFQASIRNFGLAQIQSSPYHEALIGVFALLSLAIVAALRDSAGKTPEAGAAPVSRPPIGRQDEPPSVERLDDSRFTASKG